MGVKHAARGRHQATVGERFRVEQVEERVGVVVDLLVEHATALELKYVRTDEKHGVIGAGKRVVLGLAWMLLMLLLVGSESHPEVEKGARRGATQYLIGLIELVFLFLFCICN